MEPSGVQRIRSFATYHKIHNAGGAAFGGAAVDQANLAATRVVNFHTGTLDRITIVGGAGGRAPAAPGGANGGAIFVRPRIRMLCSSMIVAKQGCGELLVAYPLTSVSTVATAPEQMRMQYVTFSGASCAPVSPSDPHSNRLRVFMGAAMYKSEVS